MNSTIERTGNLIKEDEFQYGKFSYQKIDRCTELGYLSWYYENNSPKDSITVRKNALNRIKILEPTLTDYNGKIITKEEKSKYLAVINNINLFKEMNLAKITFQKNPDPAGYINHFGMKLKFENVQYHTYNGYEYFLPVFDGKSKRIKNKLFKVFAIPEDTDEGTLFHIKKLTRLNS